MIRQCAWCLKMMGEVEPLDIHDVTHGVCEECFEKQMKQIKKMKVKEK